MAIFAIQNIQVCWVFVAVQVSRVNLALLLVEVVVRKAEGVVRLVEGVDRLAGEAPKCLVLGELGFSMLAEVVMGKVEQEITDMKQLVLIEVSIIILETFNTKVLMAEVLMRKVHVDQEVAIMKQLVMVEAEVTRLAEVLVAMVDQEIAEMRQLVLVKVKFTRLAGE